MIRLDSRGLIDWNDVMAAMDEIEKGLEELLVREGQRKGRTSEQMLAAPPRAVFVCCKGMSGYAQCLANHLRRNDLRIVGPSWLEEEGWRGGDFSAVVLDHALQMTAGQRRGLSGLLRMVRQRGDTVKVSQTPERQKLTPALALVGAVEQAAHVWDRAWASLDHGQGKSEQARAAAARCMRQAMERQTQISAIISEASEAMEACVDAGLGQEAREWIDTLDELRRISDAVGVAVRLANGNSSDPYHPQSLEFMWGVDERTRKLANLRDGEPCGHPGCLSHVSHPCEGCGRVAGRRLVGGDG